MEGFLQILPNLDQITKVSLMGLGNQFFPLLGHLIDSLNLLLVMVNLINMKGELEVM